MFSWIKKVFLKCYANRVLRYIFYGGLTTLVNLGVYAVLRIPMKEHLVIANVISVGTAILFAYVVNARFVFESGARKFRDRLQEFFTFVGARLSTMVIEVGGVWLMTDVLHINDMLGKFVIQFIVLALNYICSRFLVFRKPKRT